MSGVWFDRPMCRFCRPADELAQAGMDRLGASLQLLRPFRGFSQRRLEDATGIDQTTICRLENGRTPGFRVIRLARILEVLEVALAPRESLLPGAQTARRSELWTPSDAGLVLGEETSDLLD